MKKLIKTFKYISILILALSFVGCEDDDAFLPQVDANFTYTINVDTGTVTFLNISENANNYEWSFGDGNTSNLVNPVKTYPSGTYKVILKAKNVAGASDTFESEIVISIPEVLAFPISFDNANVNYGAAPFDGTAFQIVANPAPGGSNNVASNVGEVTNSGAAFEGIAFELGEDLDLSTQKSIKINFWSNVAVDVLFKLEITQNDAVETTASHTGSGWEELTFNFTSGKSYPKIVIFVDGPGTTAGTFYIDDIIQVETPAPLCEAETMQSLSAADFNLTFMADPSASVTPDGGVLTVINNPDAENDVNKSCKVGEIVRDPNLAFANTQIELDAKLDFNSNTGFKLKVWSPSANTNVLVKLEDKALGNSGPFKEVSATTGDANTWQELTFDFAAADSGNFDRIVLFFQLGQNVAETYYIDDFALYGSGTGSGGGGGSDENLVLNFENNLDGVTTGEFETGGVLIANPVSGGINTSPNVYEASYTSGNQWWGGIGFVFADGLDQATTVYKAKLYSTVAPTNVLFQVEVDGTNAPVGDVQEITTANEWVEVTFTLANIPSGVNRILIRPDVGSQGGTKPNTGSLYIDDITKVTDGGGSGGSGGGGGSVGPDGEFTTNGDFESGTNSGYTIFDGNGGAFSVTNEEANGGSFSGKLTSGEGTEVVVKQANIAIGTVTPNTEVTISFDLKGSLEGAGGVVFVEFFSELGTEGVSKAEILSGGPITPTDSWQSYSFTTTTGNDVSGGVTVQLKTACGPVNGCNVVAYFDNVSVKF